MDWRDRIVCDPRVLMGLPCIRGTEILVWQIVEEVSSGEPMGEILCRHPSLMALDIDAAICFARAWANENIPPRSRAGLAL